MKILMHYTTSRSAFDSFHREGKHSFRLSERIEKVAEFYDKYNRTQHHMFFIVSYCDLETHEVEYTVCNIIYNTSNDMYEHQSVSEEMCKIIYDELGLVDSNTYDHNNYYRIFTIEEEENIFININSNNSLNKIRMKFFSWDELMIANDILFNEISDILFNTENVLKIASTYRPNINYSDEQKRKKYFDALKMIGFISSGSVDITKKTLHGDIGEFLMHVMLAMFLDDNTVEKYIYPKLVLKTSPQMPVYGNDGTIYIKDKKEIFYLEAKFYKDLNIAIKRAVESLIDHNEVSNENFNHRIELFRNVKTDQLDEIIEIDEDVKENLAIFIMCENYTYYDDILKVVIENKELDRLKKEFGVIIFVLPILNKDEYLKNFQERGSIVWEELNAR